MTTGEEQAPGAAPRPGGEERHLLTQYAVTRVLAEATNLDEAVPAILRAIGENLDWDVGHLWQLDADAHILRCVESWARPTAPVDGFIEASRQRTFAPDAGLPGRVWTSRQSRWIEDLIHDVNFPRGPAAAAGLQSGVGFPIRLGDGILGVMEFFSQHRRPPDAGMLQVFDALGSQIGQFIERKRIEDNSINRAINWP